MNNASVGSNKGFIALLNQKLFPIKNNERQSLKIKYTLNTSFQDVERIIIKTSLDPNLQSQKGTLQPQSPPIKILSALALTISLRQ